MATENLTSTPPYDVSYNFVPIQQNVCPNCGYCPFCGRGPQFQPWQPLQPYTQPFWGTSTVSSPELGPVTVRYGEPFNS